MSPRLRLLTTLAVEVAFKRSLLPAWSQKNGDLDVVWAPTNVLMDQIAQGARGDVVIVIDKPMAKLAAEGIVDQSTIVPIAQAKFGLGVQSGTNKPDISTPEAFAQAVTSARSVAYSLTGASGRYFVELVERLGIADQVLPKAVTIDAGFTGEKLLTGEADLAVQQVSELMSVDGVDVVGPFPDPLQQPTDFSAAIFADAAHPDLARRFIAHLTSSEAADAYRSGGLTPRNLVRI
ncbi:molybdate ABC transporter substrate-binding protein [Devosia naphthalenivorans]|uniref:molybdate ABC transporter substrate-binding protein n=1 Tax=Devosia naphthalenivorans TaxID=2082392 RepID=UPI000D3844D9|nr:substrate-binding domain-containing protein [Devosia naphthalenivorans]